jgi:hypothetical protein
MLTNQNIFYLFIIHIRLVFFFPTPLLDHGCSGGDNFWDVGSSTLAQEGPTLPTFVIPHIGLQVNRASVRPVRRVDGGI